METALKFLTSGYPADVDSTLNGALFSVDYNEMVIVRDIDYYSLCEHHLLPFFGKLPRRLYSEWSGDRAQQVASTGGHLCAAAATAGAHDQPDC